MYVSWLYITSGRCLMVHNISVTPVSTVALSMTGNWIPYFSTPKCLSVVSQSSNTVNVCFDQDEFV